MAPDELDPEPRMPFEPEPSGIPGLPKQNPSCTVTVIQQFVNGQMVTKIEGHIDPGGTLTQVAALMVLADASRIIIGNMAQAEVKRGAEGNNGTPKKPAKPDIWVPERFKGGN